MTRRAEEWVQREFGPRIRMLSPQDPQGPTIIWGRREVYLPPAPASWPKRLLWWLRRQKVATGIHHTYVGDFLLLASELIEDVARYPDDAAVRRELRERGLVPV